MDDIRVTTTLVLLEEALKRKLTRDEKEEIESEWGETSNLWCLKCGTHYMICICRGSDCFEDSGEMKAGRLIGVTDMVKQWVNTN